MLNSQWWPVNDDEWEFLNFPEKFKAPNKDNKPIDKKQNLN